MRFLIYAGMLYIKYIESDNGYHRFSKSQQKAPTPKCVCFYNGTDNKQDKIILRLSDAFEKDSEPDMEVKVTMININYEHNKNLMSACKSLNEYDESRTLAEQRDESRVEGILNTLISLVKKGLITSDAANTANMIVAEFELKTSLKA